LLAGVSLLYVNRRAGWDVAAPYFFGSYGLGVLLAWRHGRSGDVALAVALSVTLLALWLEWRWRIAVSMTVVLAMVAWAKWGTGVRPGRMAAAWAALARISYGVFLVHFPVSLVVNAAFTRHGPQVPGWQLCGVVVAWAASIGAGALFHRWVERPAQALWRPAQPRPALVG
jgi:peptidoglycan/LPS O-acetylase OafA/YrhL